MSNETGRDEIYVQPFSVGGNKASGKWMVSRGTRGMARWRGDSKELMFVNGEGAIVAVDVAAGAAFQASAPKKLFQMPLELLEQPEPGNDRRRDTRRAAAADGDAGAGKRTARARRRPELAGRPEAISSGGSSDPPENHAISTLHSSLRIRPEPSAARAAGAARRAGRTRRTRTHDHHGRVARRRRHPGEVHAGGAESRLAGAHVDQRARRHAQLRAAHARPRRRRSTRRRTRRCTGWCGASPARRPD